MNIRSAFLQPFKSDFDGVIAWFQKECQTIRTGRATPALVEDAPVEVYGVRGPLKQYASITVSDPKTLMVQPWDATTLKDIERALSTQGRGFSISAVSANQLRISLPLMTEENRKDLLKVLRGKLEQARTQLRQLRDRIRDDIQKKEKTKEITQDDRYSLQKELDECCGDVGKNLETMTQQKEKDIMTV
ncbi:ribosome recycling factor [Candidatus Uhrbacteria bacterium]|nr:ribosome recycling factor [Candidatus Uhrbacteria bacterium]